MRLAIYGKGGIGKSTVSANLSAALAAKGKRVLQIGCDPKHDSTRLLIGGRLSTTVLDYLRATDPDHRSLDDVIHMGYNGIMCVEAGGPEPGVGCAGRGIISTFELLEELGIADLEPQITIYDVLGDVVCGGFAVPLRREYAESILIVTSGEFMSIYAANNILRGVRNYDGERRRMAGLIMNSRGDGVEEERVRRFARAVGLPIITSFPRSDRFLEAEREGRTVVEIFPGSDITGKFMDLAQSLIDGMELHEARPLEEEELEHAVLGIGSSPSRREEEARNGREIGVARRPIRRYLSKNVRMNEPLYGCAFTGALSCTVQIQGSITVAHGPRSCGDIASQSVLASGRRTLIRDGRRVPGHLDPKVVITDMTEESMVFGGIDRVEKGLSDAIDSGLNTIFLITTCPAGIIGDDVERVVDEVMRDNPGVRIIPIETWGNISGDYMQGVINASIQGAGALVDPSIETEGAAVNLVGEKTIATNADRNFEETRRLLEGMGVEVNCRFVARTSVNSLRTLRRADLNLVANNDYFSSVLREYLEKEHDQRFIDLPLPIGRVQTGEWLSEIGRWFEREEMATGSIELLDSEYWKGVREIRPSLEGKRIMIFTWNHDVDWLIELAMDMGMEVPKVCVFNKPDYGRDWGAITKYSDIIDFEVGYSPERREGDIMDLSPDLVLSNYVPAGMPDTAHYDTIPFCPDVGYLSGLEVAERWRRMLLLPVVEGWRRDEHV